MTGKTMVNESTSLAFNYKDALIMYSVYRPADTVKEVAFIDILSFYDYINHDVLTFEELSESAGRLIRIGWIDTSPHTISATTMYRQWWAEKFSEKRRSVHKQLKEIEIYLNLNFNNVSPQSEMIILLDRKSFETAQKKYLSGE